MSLKHFNSFNFLLFGKNVKIYLIPVEKAVYVWKVRKQRVNAIEKKKNS
jgi:flagellar biogenesis protein FliO